MKGEVYYWRELPDKKRIVMPVREGELVPAASHGPFTTARDARLAARTQADPRKPKAPRTDEGNQS